MVLDEKELWLWFVGIKGVGRITRNRLLDDFGNVEKIYRAGDDIIDSKEYLRESQKRSILKKDDSAIKEKMQEFTKKGIAFIHQDSKQYPRRLLQIQDRPHALYCKGKGDFEAGLNVAVVGSRKCSKYGYETAYKIGYELGARNINVVSGMARGIDGAAQSGCIAAGGRTIGVLGCGVDICYPGENIELYMKIQDRGLIISENAPGTKPSAGLFPERNRVIAGLADVIIVVEAGEKSGTFITVDMALEQGKEVFAVPGRICDLQSIGCNKLIKQGACIYDDINSFLDEIPYTDCINNTSERQFYDEAVTANRPSNKDEIKVYNTLSKYPKHIDDIAKETGFDISKVMSIMMHFTMNGIVKQTAYNYFETNI